MQLETLCAMLSCCCILQMKDLLNYHIVRFVGVCLAALNQYVFTKYCQKKAYRGTA